MELQLENITVSPSYSYKGDSWVLAYVEVRNSARGEYLFSVCNLEFWYRDEKPQTGWLIEMRTVCTRQTLIDQEVPTEVVDYVAQLTGCA